MLHTFSPGVLLPWRELYDHHSFNKYCWVPTICLTTILFFHRLSREGLSEVTCKHRPAAGEMSQADAGEEHGQVRKSWWEEASRAQRTARRLLLHAVYLALTFHTRLVFLTSSSLLLMSFASFPIFSSGMSECLRLQVWCSPAHNPGDLSQPQGLNAQPRGSPYLPTP